MTARSTSLLAPARSELLRTQALIGGTWVGDPQTCGFPVFDPATADEITRVVEGTPALARNAVDAAAAAYRHWRKTTGKARAALLRRWFDLVLAHREDLARLVSWEVGKPLAESRSEVDYAAGFIDWFAEEAKRADGEALTSPWDDRRLFAIREPIGVAAIVTPWNFPIAMVTRKAAPAIAAGCSVVAKPSEDTPLCMLALAALMEDAGAPPGLMNVVPASREAGAAVVQAWLDDERVRKLSFTGSTSVGKLLARGAVDTLKRVSLELGGDAPFIVFEDADLDVAVSALLKAKFRNAGQACVAANRVLVQAGVYERFRTQLEAAVSKLTVGAASDAAADIGPLIHERALSSVERVVRESIQAGASLSLGGRRLDRSGAFMAPTILHNVVPSMACWSQEVFGPVLAIGRFETEADAVACANASPYGLAAYVCTQDASRQWRMAQALEVGMIGVNEGAISTEVAPFGGVKQSGYGREGSRHGMSEYQSLKYVCLGAMGASDAG